MSTKKIASFCFCLCLILNLAQPSGIVVALTKEELTDLLKDPKILRSFTDAIESERRNTLAKARKATIAIKPHKMVVQGRVFDSDQFSGSGVIVKENLIVTNKHVADPLKTFEAASEDELNQFSYEIKFHDERIFYGNIVLVSKITDLVIIMIENPPSDITVMRLGDMKNISVGDEVWAIGSPFMLDQTVSKGIISSKERQLEELFRDIKVIQTDAAVNRGNSGGPLVNKDGELVGINTAIMGMFNAGVAFALPVNLVMEHLEMLASMARAEGWIGVNVEKMDNVTLDEYRTYSPNYPKDEASSHLHVSYVDQNGPAKDKVLPKDIILKVDNKIIEDANHFTRYAASRGSGAKIKLEIFRRGKIVNVEVETVIYKKTPRDKKSPHEHRKS